MSRLRKLFVAIALMIVIAGTALAGCPNPGEMIGPPCVASQEVTDDANNQTVTTTTTLTQVEVFAVEAAIAGLENLLTVY